MKVALVSSSSGSHGGGEFYLRELACGLQDAGHDPTVWLSKHGSMEALSRSILDRNLKLRQFDYLNTYQRKGRSLSAWLDRRTAARLSAEFQQSEADVIHINQQCLEDGLDLLRAAADSGKPAVSTIHVTRSAKNLGARLGWLRDLICRQALRSAAVPLIGISDVSAGDLAAFVAGSDCPPHVTDCGNGRRWDASVAIYSVLNGVPQVHQISAATQREMRESVGVRSNDLVIGVIARIEEQKNPMFMCRLLSELPLDIHCVWVGDGRLRRELEVQIDRSGLQRRFHLAGWQDQAARWLSIFDVFVLPSLFEGLPLALLEAMSAARPCVVSDVDGTRDAIQDGVNGYLCPVNDVNAWVNVLRPLIESAELRSKIGNAARERYEAEFSIQAMTQRTVAVYEQVIEARR